MTHITSAHILLAKNNMKYIGKYNPNMCLDIVVQDMVNSTDDLPHRNSMRKHQKLKCSSQVLDAISPLALLNFSNGLYCFHHQWMKGLCIKTVYTYRVFCLLLPPSPFLKKFLFYTGL